MLKPFTSAIKKFFYKYLFSFLIARLGQGIMRLMLKTCKWQVEGLEHFKTIASQNKCILMLWHNRLALTPFILDRYAPHFIYAALISNSRDGDLISAVVHTYPTGRTIRVPHHSRHQALREMIQYLDQKKGVVVITPDGPKGPRYEIKPGIAIAALETAAPIVPLTWTASHYWEFNTWDRLKLPKPFSKITVSFAAPLQFSKESAPSLTYVQEALKESLET